MVILELGKIINITIDGDPQRVGAVVRRNVTLGESL